MNKRKVCYRKSRFNILIMMVLLACIIGISIGFATFTNLLEIKKEAMVKPDSKLFKVNFSASNTFFSTDLIDPIKSDDEIVASSGVISNGDIPSISNLSATFTQPNQNVIYKFYSYNLGKYDAFLKEVTYNNIDNDSVYKKCSAISGEDANEKLLSYACEDVKVTIKVGEEIFSETTTNITEHKLRYETAEPIEVKLEYLDNSHFAYGDFKVKFGSISLKYSSID